MSLMQLTAAQGKLCKSKPGLSLMSLLLNLSRRRKDFFPAGNYYIQSTLSPLPLQPLPNQLPENDQGWKKLQEGSGLQHALGDETLQIVALPAIHPTQRREIRRPPASSHSPADWRFERKEGVLYTARASSALLQALRMSSLCFPQGEQLVTKCSLP